MAADGGLADLGRRLGTGTLSHLEPEELDAILGWVAGSQRRTAVELRTLLGSPEADPALLLRVYQQLDRVLFRNGGLLQAAAGVSGKVPGPQRRARYRRLMAAFHPDRSQDLAEWLTPRSQAILHAYAAFRRGETAPEEAPPKPTQPAAQVRPRRRIVPRVHFGPGLLATLRTSLRGVRYLEAKVLAIVAVAVFLPVLVLYLNQYPVPAGYDVPTDWTPAPEGSPGLPEAGLAPQSRIGFLPLSLASLGAHPSPLFSAGLRIDAEPAPQPFFMHVAPDAWAPALEALTHKAEAERVAARDELARALAAQEIAAIEAAAEKDSLRRREAREAAAREVAAREAAARETAAREAAAREAAAGEAAARETATREAAAREAAAREAAAREAAAREASAREAAARQVAAHEAATREAAAREAAARQTAAREAAVSESPPREAAAREAAAREAAAREATAREAAAREAAAREATAREAAARESAAREVAAREVAAREAAAREAATREAAAREAAAREVAVRETAAREAPVLEVAAIGAAPMSMTQLRVAALIDSYRIAFENGDIVAFMRHFGPEPRENTNRGRAWFEKNYNDLFAQSRQRKFALDITNIAPTGEGDWKVSAKYDLRVDYLTRPPVLASGAVHYRIQPQAEGWRIDSIDYGN